VWNSYNPGRGAAPFLTLTWVLFEYDSGPIQIHMEAGMAKVKTSGLIVALIGFLIIVTPNWILPVCEGLLELANGKQVPMRCFWTARSEMVLGGLVLISGLMIAYVNSSEARRRLNHQVVFLGLATILVPLFIIPTCMNPDMACNVGTKPALLLLGGLTMALGLFGSRATDSVPRTVQT
jgi:hypothetical protein